MKKYLVQFITWYWKRLKWISFIWCISFIIWEILLIIKESSDFWLILGIFNILINAFLFILLDGGNDEANQERNFYIDSENNIKFYKDGNK